MSLANEHIDHSVLSQMQRLCDRSELRHARAQLVDWMANEVQAGRHCQGCSGQCCTFSANSMQITPTEAMTILLYLYAEGRLTSDLKDQLTKLMQGQRLDQPPPGDGRRVFGRRRYTCPFFQHSSFGCTLSRQSKPLGCLAFHPTVAGKIEGESCTSQQSLLAELTEPLDEPVQDNSALHFSWAKQPIPVAVLEVWRVLAPNLFH